MDKLLEMFNVALFDKEEERFCDQWNIFVYVLVIDPSLAKIRELKSFLPCIENEKGGDSPIVFEKVESPIEYENYKFQHETFIQNGKNFETKINLLTSELDNFQEDNHLARSKEVA